MVEGFCRCVAAPGVKWLMVNRVRLVLIVHAYYLGIQLVFNGYSISITCVLR